MDVSALISRISQDFSQSRTSESNQKSGSQPPQEPSAKFVPQQQGSAHAVYTAKGALLKLGTVPNLETAGVKLEAALLKLAFGGSESAASVVPLPQLADEYGASLLAQIFNFLKEGLVREDKKKKRKKKPFELSSESEEKALDLLEDILDLAEEADDMKAFCDWLEQRISGMLKEVEKRHKLPAELRRTFEIMEEAAMALRHGVSPSYIKQRLEQEIERKQDG